MNNKLLTLLGFAQRAGKAVAGNDLVQAEIKRGNVVMVFIANDISPQSEKKIANLCELNKILISRKFDTDTLSAAIGKSGRTVVGIKRSELSQAIIKLISEDNLSE